MLDADMNVRYWGYLGRRYYALDKYSKIFLAVMSSGTVASWGIWTDIDILWKVLSGISALIAISLPILNFQRQIELVTAQRREWLYLKNEYDNLWLILTAKAAEEVVKEYKKLKTREITTTKDESKLPHDEKLLNKCYQEVLVSRGLGSLTLRGKE